MTARSLCNLGSTAILHRRSKYCTVVFTYFRLCSHFRRRQTFLEVGLDMSISVACKIRV